MSIAEGLHGRAADVNGVVTVRGLFEFVRNRMALEVERQSPELYIHRSLSDIGEFPITYGGGISQFGHCGDGALLAASDYYEQQHMNLPNNERVVHAISTILAEAGGFEYRSCAAATLHHKMYMRKSLR